MSARAEVETGPFLQFVRRIIRRAGARVGQADDWELGELVGLRDEVEDAIARAVQGLRAQGHSWAYIGDGLGISRQAAQQRYGKAEAA